MIYSSLPDNFIPEEIVLLEDFASDLSYGLEAWSARIARDQAEEEVRKLNAELEQRVQKRTMDLLVINNELDAFSYSVSHDLRAPLRSMDGFSQALLDGYGSQLDETGRGYLHRIRTAAQRMALLIDALLRLSKVTRGEIQFGSVDLSGLANEVLDELRMTQPERVVETIISPNLVAQADANLIQIAINNLLRNAWKFTSKKDAARIEFGQIDMEGKQAFFVRDNGAGFDMAYAHNLFGAFQRLHSETEFEGSGIGLAMVRRIIQRHGGIVWAEAADGQGATFYFTLK
jgi:light-regulated signal transduction histidine kinase (bacteriophytochrome)